MELSMRSHMKLSLIMSKIEKELHRQWAFSDEIWEYAG